jgi:hypothetical protein
MTCTSSAHRSRTSTTCRARSCCCRVRGPGRAAVAVDDVPGRVWRARGSRTPSSGVRVASSHGFPQVRHDHRRARGRAVVSTAYWRSSGSSPPEVPRIELSTGLTVGHQSRHHDEDWPHILAVAFAAIVGGRETYAYPGGVDGGDRPDRGGWTQPPGRTVVAVDGDQVLGSAKMGPNRPGRGAHSGHRELHGRPGQPGPRGGAGDSRSTSSSGPGRPATTACSSTPWETNTSAVRLWESLGLRDSSPTVPGAFEPPRATAWWAAHHGSSASDKPAHTPLCPKWRAGTYPATSDTTVMRGVYPSSWFVLTCRVASTVLERGSFAGHRDRWGPFGGDPRAGKAS